VEFGPCRRQCLILHQMNSHATIKGDALTEKWQSEARTGVPLTLKVQLNCNNLQFMPARFADQGSDTRRSLHCKRTAWLDPRSATLLLPRGHHSRLGSRLSRSRQAKSRPTGR
jgi:hypothetical protein